MALNSGQRLGPYEVVSSIGAGGMGEVYRARDPRLGRDVAIKVLPQEVASEPERLQRFEREARAASALNHPNIITVHDVGKEGSIAYMAIELIDGKTLRDLLEEGPLPVRKLLDVAVQIANGLAAAHDAGIIHRDLKPRNIMVSRTGFVKILDFGLAKGPVSPLATSETASETVTTPATDPGLLLGTTEYMSPEQIRGKTLDFRSDQFSFGATLYEMATGRRAFSRETRADTMTAILQQEPPPIAQLRPEVPAPLRWIIDRCLSKSAADRYASTGDLARELQALREHISELSGERAAEPSRPQRRRRIPLFVAVAVCLTAVAIWLAVSGRQHAPAGPLFRRLTFRLGLVSRALFVPNSNSILYSATWDGDVPRTFVRIADSLSQDRSVDALPQVPMGFSEDGSQVLTVLGPSLAARGLTGTLAWLPALGGKSRVILEGAAWSDWGRRIHKIATVRDVGPERQLEIRNPDGDLERVIFRTSGGISFVRFSPDNQYLAFLHHPIVSDPAGEVRIVSIDGRVSRVLGERYALTRGIAWHGEGREVWLGVSQDGSRPGGIFAIDLSGKSRLVYALPGDFILQDVSLNGDRFLLLSNEQRTRLMMSGPNGSVRDLSWYNQTFVTDLSPDGKSVLFYDGGLEIPFGTWIRSVEGGDAVRLGEWEDGRFSPDGLWIVATTPPRLGPPQILIRPSGPGAGRQLTATSAVHWSPSFAGQSEIVFVKSEGDQTAVCKMAVGGGPIQVLVHDCDRPAASGTGSLACVGLDGRRLYVSSTETSGRVHELRFHLEDERFRFLRWSTSSDRLFALTTKGRVLTINPVDGSLVSERNLPTEGSAPNAVVLEGAINGTGSIVAYSVTRFGSSLYLVSGLK